MAEKWSAWSGGVLGASLIPEAGSHAAEICGSTAGAAEPPCYRRAPSGSMLDPLDLVLRRLVADFEGIRAPRVTELLRDDYGYGGSVDLVGKRVAGSGSGSIRRD